MNMGPGGSGYGSKGMSSGFQTVSTNFYDGASLIDSRDTFSHYNVSSSIQKKSQSIFPPILLASHQQQQKRAKAV